MRRPTFVSRAARLAFATLLFIVPAGGAPAGAAPPPDLTPVDKLRAYSIVPPGQEGNVTAAELATGDFGPHYDDQLEPYAGLIDDDDVTEGELSTHYHAMQFGPEGAVEREYSPTPGATVYRDSFGFPHVYANSLRKASFALGYVSAEDRLWQMDVFRHAGRGTLTEFVGDGEDGELLRMDIDTRREGYTESEITRMFRRLDDKAGAAGEQVQRGLHAYKNGINAYIEEVKTTRVDELPVEYQATGNPPPEDWSVQDTLFLVVLQLRLFGETAGGELDNAALYAHLSNRLGPTLGRRVFGDLLAQNVPRSPTTIGRHEARFPSQNLGRVDPQAVAIPDRAARLSAGEESRTERRAGLRELLGLSAPSSNALLVSAAESATGNPLEIGAPQVGYAVPAFFMDIDVHVDAASGEDVHFRGPAVPGASALIPLGRGADYAWSLTTGMSDAVDVRAEKLCDPNGGRPRRSSIGYIFRGECERMDSREETFVVKSTPFDPPDSPPLVTRTFNRTRHGPVFERGRVNGHPVAFVKERFFWKRELDSVPQFLKWNTQVDSLDDFKRAARSFTMSFNAFYADAEHVGYFHVGYYPRRERGVHPALPVWGTGRWEWEGRFPFRRQPKIVDPDRGWVANWNNKPARGWDSFDGFKWGAVQRVELLHDQMRTLLAGGGQAELSDLVDVIRTAATQDARGAYLGAQMTRWARRLLDSDRHDRAAAIVRRWVKLGAHRTNRDRDGDMDRGPALAIFDRWWKLLVHAIFDDELGRKGYRLMDAPVADYSPQSGSSFFFDFSSYLRTLFDRGKGSYARNYCDDLSTGDHESCRGLVASSLRRAVRELTQEQGRDMSAWEKLAENLQFQELGAGSVPEIPWQNRGTHNHVVEILEDLSP